MTCTDLLTLAICSAVVLTFSHLDLKESACIICIHYTHERKPKLILPPNLISQMHFSVFSTVFLLLLLVSVPSHTSCCLCSSLNIKEVSVPLTSPAAEIVWQPDILTDSSKFCAPPSTTALKTAKWLTRPGISKWVCKKTGYWVTLSIAVAVAFHFYLHSVHLCLPPSLPSSALFLRLTVGVWYVFVNWITWLPALLFLIQSAQGFPDSVGWHTVYSIYYLFTRFGKKIKWNVWCAQRNVGPTYCNNLSRSPLASLVGGSEPESSWKTHRIECNGSPTNVSKNYWG